MRSITDAEFGELLANFKRDARHLETRDAYGTAVELPHLAQWMAGEHDDLDWLQGWCTKVRGHVSAGRSVRRARIVSEPLSHQAGGPVAWVGGLHVKDHNQLLPEKSTGFLEISRAIVKLTFLGTTSSDGSCPTLYETDRDTYVVQGYTVTDPEALASLRDVLDGETFVEVPKHLLKFSGQ